jgi:hypothetical protein
LALLRLQPFCPQITRTPDESFLAFLLGTGDHALLPATPHATTWQPS